MSELQSRFDETKKAWAQRLDDFGRMAKHNAKNAAPALRLPLTPFRVLLQLFAYEENVFPDLDRVFDMDDGLALTFYVPQLLSFLIHGAYDNASDLEQWILQKCRQNVHFAHKCFWFLRAWCLEGSHEVTNGSPHQAASLAPSNSQTQLAEMAQSVTANSGILPEERTVMEGLLQRVIECGEIPSQLLEFGDGLVQTYDVKNLDSASEIMEVACEGKIPLDPAGFPNVKHLDSITAPQRYGFLPVQNLAIDDPDEDVLFGKAPKFCDALLQMADHLFTLPREQRTVELRKCLEKLELEHLPSNSIYMPLNNTHHRVWRIVADESIAISTKERVPCIVCLEVVDYLPSRSKNQGNNKLGFLELMRNDSSEDSPSSPASPMSSWGRHTQCDERELLQKWSKTPRNPRRHSTLLDNITSFTQDTVRLTQETVRRFQQQTGPQDVIWTQLTNSASSIQEEEEDEETGSLAAATDLEVEAPMTPTKDVKSSSTLIGQWASPSSPHKIVSQRRRERLINDTEGSPPGADNVELLGALMDIREKNQRTKSTNGNSNNAYGTSISTKARSKKPARPPPVVFKESWATKQERIRKKSSYGNDPNWRLFPILIKSNDDLRQEQLASQLIYRMASILAHEKVPVWLCPYEIVALSESGGIIEAIPDTISLDSLKRNDENYTSLWQFFRDHFGEGGDEYLDAKANFVESLAAYSIVCFLLQIKDRHNGNILLDNRGHLIHIDFGFFFLSSPGKNSGFESAPFKLTSEFVQLLDGPDSKTFRTFRDLCCRTFLTLRRHCYEITLLVEMLCTGNEDLACFRGRPKDAVRGLKERFRLDLNDRACIEYVNSLVDESLSLQQKKFFCENLFFGINWFTEVC